MLLLLDEASSQDKCNETFVAAVFPDPITPRSVVAWRCDPVAPAAWPQTPGRTYRIGIITRDRRAWAPLFDELRANGFVEGKNLLVIGEFGLPLDHYDTAAPELANGLAKAGVDAILTAGALGTRAAQRATQSIPILATSDDLVGEGFATSLAHPGGNITGMTNLAPELDRKRQEILLELVPSARHVAVLAESRHDAATAASGA